MLSLIRNGIDPNSYGGDQMDFSTTFRRGFYLKMFLRLLSGLWVICVTGAAPVEIILQFWFTMLTAGKFDFW